MLTFKWYHFTCLTLHLKMRLSFCFCHLIRTFHYEFSLQSSVVFFFHWYWEYQYHYNKTLRLVKLFWTVHLYFHNIGCHSIYRKLRPLKDTNEKSPLKATCEKSNLVELVSELLAKIKNKYNACRNDQFSFICELLKIILCGSGYLAGAGKKYKSKVFQCQLWLKYSLN